MNSIILTGMAWAASLKDAITSRIGEERGQDLLEYVILGGGIAIALALILYTGVFNAALTQFRTTVGNCISFQIQGPCP